MKLWLIATELARRPRRTVTGVISVGLGVGLFLSLQAYATGYREAAREPLALIGSDVVAQRQGNRPESFEGVVFPHSTSPIHNDEVDRVRRVAGVEAVAPAMFFWSFQNKELVVGLGIDTSSDVGPSKLAAGVSAGRFLTNEDRQVVVLDDSYAKERGLVTGSRVSIAGEDFSVVGTVDTSRAGQVANANAYLPLADSQRLVEASAGVRAVHDVRQGDANVLFVRSNPARGLAVAEDITAIMGKEAIVTTPRSFDQVLGPSFTVIDRFGLIIGLVALALAAASLLRVVLSTLMERRRDIAVLRAVGWTRTSLRGQLVGESTLLTATGLVAGMAFASVTGWILRQTLVTIPVPWELSPTPHFVAGGARQLAIDVPLAADLQLTSIGVVVAVGVLVAIGSGLAASRRASNIKPSEVWRVD
jgi:ABC-type antimicrobial peptide transport system permease subunit